MNTNRRRCRSIFFLVRQPCANRSAAAKSIRIGSQIWRAWTTSRGAREPQDASCTRNRYLHAGMSTCFAWKYLTRREKEVETRSTKSETRSKLGNYLAK